MSPPIRDGSGNSIGSIRLGDGSEISEVRTGAGDVVFSAGLDIPDSGLLHNLNFDAGSTTTSFVEDQKGNSNLGNGSFSSFTSINGRQAGQFDGVDDELFTTVPNINKDDAYVFVVAQYNGPFPSNSKVHVFGEEDENGFDFGVDGSSFHLNPFGSDTSGGTADTNPHIFEVDAENGQQVELLVDGSVAISANDQGGNTTFGGFFVGRSKLVSFFDFGEFAVGQILIYDEPQVNKTKVRQSLSDFWGISV